MAVGDSAREAGRPRDPAIDAAVIAATTKLLRQHPYADVSLTMIAEEANTTRQAISRRWSSKAELVLAATFEVTAAAYARTAIPKGLAGLRVLVDMLASEANDPVRLRSMAGLMVDLGRDRLLQMGMQVNYLDPMRKSVAWMLRTAEELGEIGPGSDPDVVVAALTGGLFLQASVLGRRPDDAFVDGLLELVRAGLPRPVATATSTI